MSAAPGSKDSLLRAGLVYLARLLDVVGVGGVLLMAFIFRLIDMSASPGVQITIEDPALTRQYLTMTGVVAVLCLGASILIDGLFLKSVKRKSGS